MQSLKMIEFENASSPGIGISKIIFAALGWWPCSCYACLFPNRVAVARSRTSSAHNGLSTILAGSFENFALVKAFVLAPKLSGPTVCVCS